MPKTSTANSPQVPSSRSWRRNSLTDDSKIRMAAALATKQKSLELLFDYTKFHIGLYLTLTAAYITVAKAKSGADALFQLEQTFVWLAVVSFMCAGVAGGVIASSITQTSCRSSAEFLEGDIGPWEIEELQMKARIWTWIEHTAFWIGLIFAVLSFQVVQPLFVLLGIAVALVFLLLLRR